MSDGTKAEIQAEIEKLTAEIKPLDPQDYNTHGGRTHESDIKEIEERQGKIQRLEELQEALRRKEMKVPAVPS